MWSKIKFDSVLSKLQPPACNERNLFCSLNISSDIPLNACLSLGQHKYLGPKEDGKNGSSRWENHLQGC